MNRSLLAWAAVLALAPAAGRADVIWEADAARGLTVFEGLEQGQGTISIVNDPKGIYGKVFNYHMVDDADGTKDRVESRGHKLLDGTNLKLTEGQTYYLGWRALWDKNVGTESGKWVAVWQMHAYGLPGMGAPFVFRTLGDGMLHLQNNVVGTNQHIWNAPFVREQWQHFVVRFFLHHDASKGWIELWYNGVQQKFINGQTRFFCPTHEDEAGTANKLKWGLYRTGSASGTWNAYMSRARLGTSYEDVDPMPTGGGGGGGGGGGNGKIGMGRTEAETLTKTNYETNSFEGATCVRATADSGANVRGTFSGDPGTYTVVIRYHDEDDGQSTFRLRVAGAEIASRKANADDHTWKLWTISGVTINTGDEIRIEGTRNAGEHARLDYIQVQ